MAGSEMDDSRDRSEDREEATADAHFRIIPPEGDPSDAPGGTPEEDDATQPGLFSTSDLKPAAQEEPLPMGGPGPPDTRLGDHDEEDHEEDHEGHGPRADVMSGSEDKAEPETGGLRTLDLSRSTRRAEGGESGAGSTRDSEGDPTGVSEEARDPGTPGPIGEAGPEPESEPEPATLEPTVEMGTEDRPRREPNSGTDKGDPGGVPEPGPRPDAAPEGAGSSGGGPEPEPAGVASEPGPLIRVIADGEPAASSYEPGPGRRATATATRTEPEPPDEQPEPAPLTVSTDKQRPIIVKVTTGLVFGAVALAFILLGHKPGLATLAIIIVTWVAVEFFVLLHQVAAHRSERSGADTEVVGVPKTIDWGELLTRSPFLIGVAATLAMGILAYLYGIEAVGILTVAASLASILWYYTPGERPTVPLEQAMGLTGLLHIALLGSFALLTLRLEHGFALLLVVVILVVAFDVASYAWGISIGRHPFAPVISPNKTVEGLVGGAATTFVAAAVVVLLDSVHDVPFLSDWRDMMILTAVLVVFSLLGDLAESLVKRSFAMKDMASFLPGHGGMFDRFDGIVFSLPVAYAVFVLLGMAE